MKKYVSVVLIAIAVFLGISVLAVDDNDFTVYIDNADAKPNEKVELHISLKNNTGILAMLFELNYDSNCLNLIDVKDEKLVDGCVFGNDYSQIPYKMLWNSASETNFKDDGVLVTLIFEVLDNAPNGVTAISLTYKPRNVYDVDLNMVNLNVINGSINIISDHANSTPGAQHNSTQPSHSSGNSSGKLTNTVDQENDSNTTNESFNNDTMVDHDAEIFLLEFLDVKENDWYYQYIKTAFEKGLMKGVSDTEFSPNEKLTRAMFVTILYRMDGEPDADQTPFTDVETGSWYEKAISWACANNIIIGVCDTEFAPNAGITREQIATVLFRYLKYKKLDIDVATSEETSFSYNDLQDVSDWATEAMHYCIINRIFNGDEHGNLFPRRIATRAETAAVITRINIG